MENVITLEKDEFKSLKQYSKIYGGGHQFVITSWAKNSGRGASTYMKFEEMSQALLSNFWGLKPQQARFDYSDDNFDYRYTRLL